MPVSEATVRRRASSGASSTRELLDLEPAMGLEGRHLARDQALQRQRAALDPGGLVQGLQQVAGVVAGEPQARRRRPRG